MIKNLFYLILFGGFFYAKAQVGINTKDPKSTLDIVASADSKNIADGILIPRLTAEELISKENSYSASQDGALVFITDGVGNSSGNTSNIDGRGFYYYDKSTSKWVKIDSNSSSSSSKEALNVTSEITSNYDVKSTDDIILVTSAKSSNVTLNFPIDNVKVGKTYYVTNNGDGNIEINVKSGGSIRGGLNRVNPNYPGVIMYIGNNQYTILSSY